MKQNKQIPLKKRAQPRKQKQKKKKEKYSTRPNRREYAQKRSWWRQNTGRVLLVGTKQRYSRESEATLSPKI